MNLRKAKTQLPENWRPCEVNYPENLNQYEINVKSNQVYQSFWKFDYEDEASPELWKDAMFVTLYKNADFSSFVRSLFLVPNHLPFNFKNFIDAN
jgi:hypothetical protein